MSNLTPIGIIAQCLCGCVCFCIKACFEESKGRLPAPGCDGTVYKVLKPGSGSKSQSAGSFLENEDKTLKETFFLEGSRAKRDVLQDHQGLLRDGARHGRALPSRIVTR